MSEPQRVFLGWDEPVLPRVAAWLLDAHPFDLGDQVVVAPGRRSGRLLLAHLVAIVDRRGSQAPRPLGFVPPRIVTRGSLPELFYRPVGAIATKRERLLAWCAVLEAAPTGSLPGAGASGDVPSRLALARDLVRAQDELGEEGLLLADVPERAAAALGAAGESTRWQELGRLEREEMGVLSRAGFADPTAARLEALALDGPREAAHAVVLCCLATTRGLERVFVARYASRITALVAAPERDASFFDSWGSIDQAAWKKRRVTLPQGSLHIVGRPRDQAELVGRLVAESLAEASAGDEARAERASVTIGLADSSLAGVVREAIADRGLSCHDALGRPLASTAPWRLLEAAGRYAGSGTARDLAALLRHPDLERQVAAPIEAAVSGVPRATTRELRAAIDSKDWLTASDLYTSETVVEPGEAPLPGDAAGAAVMAALDAAVRALLGESGDLRPLGEWTERIRIFLLGVYGDRTLRDDRTDRDLVRALRSLGEELRAQAVAASAYGGGPRLRLADAIELLFSELAREPLGAESGAGSIEMVGWLEIPLDDAPRLVVAGLDEASASSPLSGGLLGPALRRSLGLEDAEALRARDLYFLELLAASREASFVTGRRGPQGEPLAPRRILLSGDTPDLVETVLAFWGDSGGDGDDQGDIEAPIDEASADGTILAKDEVSSGAAASATVGGLAQSRDGQSRGRARRGGFGPILPAPDAALPTRLPATAFRDYLACPYRFYLRHVLGLRRIGDLPRELEPGEFGRLLHAVLGRFAGATAAASDDPRAVARVLDALLDEEVARRCGSRPRVTVRLQLEQLRRRLDSFADWQAAQVRAGWAIVPEHTEARLEATLEVDGTPFVVTGRVDRVDRHPTLGLRLLDYKSAEQSVTPEQAHRGGKRGERRWLDLQLPLYELMLRQHGADGALDLGFVNLGHRLSADPLALAEWSTADLADAIATARGVVRSVRARRFWPPGEPPSYADGFEGLAGDAFPDRESYLAGDEHADAQRGSGP